MPVSKRLKDCILEHEELMEDMEGLKTTEKETQEMIKALNLKIGRKSEEIANEMYSCFPCHPSEINFRNRIVVLISNKAYLLTFQIAGNEPIVREIPIER